MPQEPPRLARFDSFGMGGRVVPLPCKDAKVANPVGKEAL